MTHQFLILTIAVIVLAAPGSAPAQSPPPPVRPNAAASHRAEPQIYRMDAREIKLAPDEGVELKYHMPKDAALVYSWSATEPIHFEFHGQPDIKPSPTYYDSYEIDDNEGRSESHGSFIAPNTGIHGWYWKNVNSVEVTVTLKAVGFFDGIKFFSKGGVQDLPVQDAP